MIARPALLALILAALSVPDSSLAQGAAAPWPETLSGVAEARIVGEDGRFTTRLAFAAAVDPPRLRIEVVKGGTLQALAWYDEKRVIVLAPGEPSLVHEGPPTRQTLQDTLGLPFCPAEIFAALRGGLAPQLSCGTGDARAVEDGVEVSAGAADGRRATLRFSRFRRDGGRPFPRRVVLDSDVARATIDIVVLQESPNPPAPPSEAQLQRSRRVSARELADALGLASGAVPPPPEVLVPEGGLGR